MGLVGREKNNIEENLPKANGYCQGWRRFKWFGNS